MRLDVLRTPAGDAPHPAVAAGEQGDDAIGLAQLLGAQHDRLVAVEGHATFSRMSEPDPAKRRRDTVRGAIRCSTRRRLRRLPDPAEPIPRAPHAETPEPEAPPVHGRPRLPLPAPGADHGRARHHRAADRQLRVGPARRLPVQPAARLADRHLVRPDRQLPRPPGHAARARHRARRRHDPRPAGPVHRALRRRPRRPDRRARAGSARAGPRHRRLGQPHVQRRDRPGATARQPEPDRGAGDGHRRLARRRHPRRSSSGSWARSSTSSRSWSSRSTSPPTRPASSGGSPRG